MVASRAELRARARASLKGNWGRAILIFIMMALFAGVPSIILNKVSPTGQEIFSLIVSGPLGFGLVAAFLAIARSQAPSVAVLFEGFEHFLKILALYLLMSLYTFLWMLLFIIPGIIAALRYSQVYYILRDNPEISASEAIQRSKEMMDGNKGRLFVLYLSFIGWFILGILTLGIGLLWVYPYVLTTIAHFYLDLKGNTETNQSNSEPSINLSK